MLSPGGQRPPRPPPKLSPGGQSPPMPTQPPPPPQQQSQQSHHADTKGKWEERRTNDTSATTEKGQMDKIKGGGEGIGKANYRNLQFVWQKLNCFASIYDQLCCEGDAEEDDDDDDDDEDILLILCHHFSC